MNTQDPSTVYEVHPAYARYPGPPRLPGESHQRGICGGNADLCGWCWEHQLAWHKKIGKEIGESDPPRPGEREGVWIWNKREELIKKYPTEVALLNKEEYNLPRI